ncbi:hypothetical protein [uncultured Sunxiuqinia sp.]|uniref:hypothetical protein n=1 Tax=uncultured Sunxiuqinia sp. TaxID=1573825 RepID=UPI0030D96F06
MKRTSQHLYQQADPAYLLILLLFMIGGSCGVQSDQKVEEPDAVVVEPDTLMAPAEPDPEEEPAVPVEAAPGAPRPVEPESPVLANEEEQMAQEPGVIGAIDSDDGEPEMIDIPMETAAPGEQVYGGQMMVYASDSMVEHRVERVMALVRQQIDVDKAIESFSQSMGISEGEVAGDSKVHDIKLSDSLRVTLVFNPDDFKLISDEAVYYRHFARGYTQYFDWEIEPLSPGDKKLTIKIENYVDHSWNNFVSPQTINIRVKVNQSTLWTRLWDTLQEDPLWLLNKILLPVLAFIAGLLATYIRKKLFGKKES